MRLESRGLMAGAVLALSAISGSQGRVSAQLSPAESREAVTIVMRMAMVFEPPATLSREQRGTVDRIVSQMLRSDQAGALKTWGELVGSIGRLWGDSSGNILNTLYFIFRESVLQGNEDKKQLLSKLKFLGLVSQAVSSYLEKLRGASAKLGTGQGTVQIDPLSIQGSGENVVVRKAARRAMGPSEVRTEQSRARKAVDETELAIARAQLLLQSDAAKDAEFLKRLLAVLKAFEDEAAKNGARLQVRRRPPPSSAPGSEPWIDRQSCQVYDPAPGAQMAIEALLRFDMKVADPRGGLRRIR